MTFRPATELSEQFRNKYYSFRDAHFTVTREGFNSNWSIYQVVDAINALESLINRDPFEARTLRYLKFWAKKYALLIYINGEDFEPTREWVNIRSVVDYSSLDTKTFKSETKTCRALCRYLNDTAIIAYRRWIKGDHLS